MAGTDNMYAACSDKPDTKTLGKNGHTLWNQACPGIHYNFLMHKYVSILPKSVVSAILTLNFPWLCYSVVIITETAETSFPRTSPYCHFLFFWCKCPSTKSASSDPSGFFRHRFLSCRIYHNQARKLCFSVHYALLMLPCGLYLIWPTGW